MRVLREQARRRRHLAYAYPWLAHGDGGESSPAAVIDWRESEEESRDEPGVVVGR